MTTEAKELAASSTASGFQQRLGLFDSVMLIVGTMIGSGIFRHQRGDCPGRRLGRLAHGCLGLAGVMTIIALSAMPSWPP